MIYYPLRYGAFRLSALPADFGKAGYRQSRERFEELEVAYRQVYGKLYAKGA